MMRRSRRITAAVCAVSMLAGVVTMQAESMNSVSAAEEQLLGETSFDYKMLPWHTVEQSPAKQNFEITNDGELHIMILQGTGAEKEKWDLQLRHRGLNFRSGRTYTVSFKVKGKRSGMELCSYISNIKGDEEYCVLFGDKLEMGNGPHMGGQWGKALKLTTDWQEVTGAFTPDKDLEACEWSFQYAKGTQYEGNAEGGDEIWFDDMSITGESDCVIPVSDNFYGGVSRSASGLDNNFISVNQVGYFPKRRKIAVLSDNSGDIMHGAETIKIDGSVDFEVINAKTGDTVFKGTSTAPSVDADSGDKICKLDFSELKEPGVYYIKAGEYRSFEFEIGNDIYSKKDHDLFSDAVNYFYQNRSGIDIEEKYITSGDRSGLAHKGGHKNDTAFAQKIWKNEYMSQEEASSTYASSEITATGGWYEAGDHSKNMVNGGMAVWTLQNLYELILLRGWNECSLDDASGKVLIPECGNKIPDILDEAAYEIDWMSQMKISADDEVWGEKAAGLYSHRICDSKYTGLAVKPWDYEAEWLTERIAKPPTFAATLNYAACAAQAARLWAPYDSTAAEYYLKSAAEAYEAYKKAYYEADLSQVDHPEFGPDCVTEELREDSLYAPFYQNETGRNYGDFDVSDEAYSAACEIFVSAKEMNKDYADEYLKELESFQRAYTIDPYLDHNKLYGGSFSSFNSTSRAATGSLTLALHRDLLPEKKAAQLEKEILETAEEYLKEEMSQGYGTPYSYKGIPWNDPENLDPHIMMNGYVRDSNGFVLNNAIVMAYAYDLTREKKYLDGVTGAMDYLLGTNPLSFSYISGYGQYCLQNPSHRYWSYELDKELPKAPDGVISGGPNSGLVDKYVRLLGFVPGNTQNVSQRCYVDSIEAWSVNSAALELNASLAWVAGYLQDQYATYRKPDDPTPVPTATDDPTAEPTMSDPGPVVCPGDRGDINLDGIVDLTDLSALAISLVDKEPLGVIARNNADVNADGNVDIVDLATLRQYLSKKIKTL